MPKRKIPKRASVAAMETDDHWLTCKGNYLGSSSVSSKHKFNEQHALELQKKHKEKKISFPMSIFCMKDRLLFRSRSGVGTSESWQKYVKYADIHHYFLNDKEQQFVLLAVVDSERKNKKYYEIFQCETIQDAVVLRERIATAIKSDTKTLPKIVYHTIKNTVPRSDYAVPGETLSENLQSNEDLTVVGQQPQVQAESISSPASPHYEVVGNIDPLSEYLQLDEELTVVEPQPRVNSKAPVSLISQQKGTLEPDSHKRYDSPNNPVTEAINNRIPAKFNPPSLSKSQLSNSQSYNEVPIEVSVSSVPCNPIRVSRESQRQSKVGDIDSLKFPVKCAVPEYRTYKSEYSWSRRVKPYFSRTEIPPLFGEDVTFVLTDNQTGAIACNSGPVFLYANRFREPVESYTGEDLVSGTNSPMDQNVR